MDADIKKRSIVSVFSLFFQSGYSAVLGLAANLIVTILLTPKIFGIYITVLSLINILNYFSDFGLAASLIQKQELDEDDVVTTFTIQQILALLLVIIGYAGTGAITAFYKLPQDGVYLYWSLLFGFFVSSFKTIPSIFLERQIKFQKVVFVQIVENTIFYALVSVCAIMGYGLMSFTIAVVVRAVVGLILIFVMSPWMPSLGISRRSAKELLSFGVPFQLSSFLALFKDDLLILYLGKVLGFELLGYIGWAKKWADAPIRIIMDNVSKILFPVLSRVQNEKEKVRNICEKLLYYQTSLLAPVIAGMVVVIDLFVQIVPKYQKWGPAVPLFYILAVSSFILSFSAPFMNLYNAIGKAKIPLFFMMILTAVNWTFTIILTHFFGIYGFVFAHLAVSTTLGILVFKAKKTFGFKFIEPVYRPLISMLLMVMATMVVRLLVVGDPRITLVTTIIVGGTTYWIAMTYVFKINFMQQLRSFTHPA
jgi:O-antigen/teichoic acid export membrane protein